MNKIIAENEGVGRLRVGIYTILLLVLLAGCSRSAAITAKPRSEALTSPLPIPTRAPTPTAVSSSFYLDQMRLALRRSTNDLATAEAAWETALNLSPADPVVQREGARLALRKGDWQVAADRVNAALRLNPLDSESWVVAGIIAEGLGDHVTAAEAFHTAEVLNPELRATLFPTRWRLAMESGDSQAISELARNHLLTHLDDAYSTYYRAEALLAEDYEELALELVLLRLNSDSPGVLWYTLGRIYNALESPENAIIALETASALQSRGDVSFFVASKDPTLDISLALGRAYLNARRCTDAITLLEYLATPNPEAARLLEKAVECP